MCGGDRLTETLPSSTHDSHVSESQISFILTELTGSMGEHIWEVLSESGLRNTPLHSHSIGQPSVAKVVGKYSQIGDTE